MANVAIEDRVVELVENYWRSANIQKVSIIETIPHFFRGRLYIVEILDANDYAHENVVYVTGDELRRYDNLQQLGASAGRDSPLAQFFESSFQIMGIAGIIAMLITVTICYVVLFRPPAIDSIPTYLSNALTLILGFYFGTTARRGSKKR